MHLPYRDRLARLADRGVGLWDVVRTCTRQRSLDAAIRKAERNDVMRLRQLAPRLQVVLFNGALAARQQGAVAAAGYRLAVLPSSSAGYAGCCFDRKLAAWRSAIRQWVRP